MYETKLITLLLTVTLLSGITLASTKASADTEVIDQVRLTVPIACTMTGENTSHTAALAPGTYSGETGSEYENGIGKTTLTAICNDDNGFSIYAIGYTGNQYSGDNHTKLVGQSTNSTIPTKAYASGDTTSNWSMKLTKVTDSTISYNPQNLTISSDTEGPFDTWHSVPDTYTKVAEYHANTGSSTTDTTLGVKLETTYAAYISSSQPADTYVGQVKYTLVHPYNAVAGKLNVTYDGNGLTFTNGQATNLVAYDATNNSAYNPIITRSAYDANGNYNGYTTQSGNNVVTVPDADSIHIKVTYGVPSNVSVNDPPSNLYIWAGSHPDYTNSNSATSLTTCGVANATDGAFMSNGNPGSQVTMECDIAGDSVTFYDYSQYTVSTGYYALVSKSGVEPYSKTVVFGTYETPGKPTESTTLYGWSLEPNASTPTYTSEADFESNAPYLNANGAITLYAVWGKTFSDAYKNHNKTKHNGYYTMQDGTDDICEEVDMDAMENLIDVRDDTTYMVRKLKDGNCWMLDNLALDPTVPTTAANMNETNTNATSSAIDNFLGRSQADMDGWSKVAVVSNPPSFQSLTNPLINTESKDTLVKSYGPNAIDGKAKVGIYYNFCAATVGTFCYSGSSGQLNPSHDICPSNWKIPSTDEYYALSSNYNTSSYENNSIQYYLSASLSGLYLSSSHNDQNVAGHYWTSTATGITEMMYIADRSFYYQQYARYYGATIRCVLGHH